MTKPTKDQELDKILALLIEDVQKRYISSGYRAKINNTMYTTLRPISPQPDMLALAKQAIQTYVAKKCREARIEELNNIPPQYAELYEKFVTAKGYKDKKVPFTPFHEIIEDRLKALQQKGKK